MSEDKSQDEVYEDLYQEIYRLQCREEAKEAVLKELREVVESLQKSASEQVAAVEKRIREADVRHRLAKEEYDEHLAELEKQLFKNTTENQKLKDLLKQKEAALDESLAQTVEERPAVSKDQLDKLILCIQEEQTKREQAEETIEKMQKDCIELEEILKATRKKLQEKTEMLEDTKEELAVCRMELEALKTCPDSINEKGNSLFAEVEDRRRSTQDKMNAMQNKYLEAKRISNAKVAEVKLLKAEKAAIVKQWENDTANMIEESDKVLRAYKCRILKLENKLSSEPQKNTQEKWMELSSTEDTFDYFQSLLASKKKEVEELQAKIEKDSLQSMVQLETTRTITKELQYWRRKAMLLEECKPESEKSEDIKSDEERLGDFNAATCKGDVAADLVTENPDVSEIYERSMVEGCKNSVLGDTTIKLAEKSVRFADVEIMKEPSERNPPEKREKEAKYPIVFLS